MKVGWVAAGVGSSPARQATPPKSTKSSSNAESTSAYTVAQSIAQAMAKTSATAYATSHPLSEEEVIIIRTALQEAVLHHHLDDMRISDRDAGKPSRLQRLKSATSLRSKRSSAAEDRVFTAPPVWCMQLYGRHKY